MANDTLVRCAELSDGFCVPGTEYVGKGAIYSAEVGEEFRFLAGSGADREVEGPRGADRFLDQVGERPTAADVSCVCGVAVGDGRGVVD